MSTEDLLEIEQNRKAVKYTRKELLGRALWGVAATTLFRFSPRICYGFRAFLLRLFGAKVGRNVHVYPTVQIMMPWKLTIGNHTAIGDGVRLYNLGEMTLGNSVTISQGAHLCGGTHDFRNKAMPLIKSEIIVEDGAWVCADAFIGPGVSVGREAVVGARAVVVKPVAPQAIVGGNPAKVIGKRSYHTDASNGSAPR